MSEYRPYELARMAGVSCPDSPDSPGAKWLELVAGEVDDYEIRDLEASTDAIHEAADQIVPAYTHERWQVFVDLAAYQEDVTEYGPVEDLTDAAGVALYMIAERLIVAIVEANSDEPDDDDD